MRRSEQLVNKLIALRKQGYTFAEIGRLNGLSRQLVHLWIGDIKPKVKAKAAFKSMPAAEAGALGGKARAKNLSRNRLSQIGREGGKASAKERWGRRKKK